MKYEEIVKSVKDSFTTVDVSDYKNHLAVQFNIIGEGEGAFYVELKEGSIDVQPYEYYDRDVIFTLSAVDLFALIDGELDPVKAYLNGKIKVSDTNKALEVKNLIDDMNKKKKPTRKTTTKRATKKTEKVESKEETPVAKEESKKTTAKTTTAKKTTSKATTVKKPTTKTTRAKKTDK